MITRFSTLYVGHIELEDCGLAGTPADNRRYPNRRLTETFDTAVALARPRTRWATRPCGWPSITSSTRATSASPTSRCWLSTSPTAHGA